MESKSPHAIAPLPANEAERVQALERYKILDTPPEEKYDQIVKAASLICGTPIALISLLDSKRQWFKAKVGLDAPETEKEISFCQFALGERKVFIVENADQDSRFKSNPLVTGPPFIRFYAGAPLNTPDGYTIGTLCVIDNKPNHLEPHQIEALQALANSVISYMELEEKSKKLIQLQAAAIELEKAKEQFFVNMNHEFRTPVHGILGMVDLLRQTNTTTVQDQYLTSLTDSADHLIRLINDVIDFSKAESGSLHFNSIEFDLIALIEKLNADASDEAFKKGLAFKTILPPATRSLFVLSDPVRMRQVFSNLVSNALKFTEKGGVTIDLSILSETEKNINFSLSVRDTGIGIDSHRMPSLFEAFSQADISSSRKYGGTGLGLAICKRICEKLGWKIRVESEYRVGSNFILDFELERVEPPKEITRNKTETNASLDFSDYSSLKILIAEDNPVNQKLIQKMLERLGLRSSVVSNGLEALAFWEEQEVDLLFLDIQMPELSGIETARILKKKPSSRRIPWIVAATAHDSPEDKMACSEAGIDDYLGKPFRIEDLAEKVREFLKNFPSSLAS
ncbi:GAF domain-containing sensor histidine kinase [Leptospira langatensis]|uniref:histidine kinase n=1 Tax=Leptospira langatensis TaxID=2484983 RepID=A0A5F1ZSN7_9LEPT|nr:ATP-binding protein [Leptospira langatensis]TGJ98819.1 GAF domain-containing sensor histidine kinase [Leptospira langatensis]TGL40614.1 GAF domain-containing sensor histidine kinase [Leptospira langatensis]